MSFPASTADAVSAAKVRPPSGRFDMLDGVRGWAALAVVLFHIFWETFGILVPAFRNPLTRFLFDGRLAVCIFFVLSGEALSAAFFAGKGDASTIRLAIKRYPRLAAPILASCLIIFALDRYGLVYSSQAATIVHRADWIGDWLRAPPTLSSTLRYSLYDVFFSDDFEHAINPMLWTMRIELVGSFLVFALALVWKRLSRPRLLLLTLFLAAAAAPIELLNFLSCFFAGVAFADWRTRGVFAAWGRRFVWVSLAAIGVIALADGVPHCFGWQPGKTAFAIVLMLAVHASPRLVALFSGRLSRALGRISFPLYLIQFPVLVSATSWLIVRAGAAGPPSLFAIWGISLASVAGCLLAAIAFSPIETLARRLGDALVALVGRAVRGWPGGGPLSDNQPKRKAEIALPPIASRKLCSPAAPSAAPTTTIGGMRCSPRG
jgi:peptidoglycan/LPS O-acetylase OafA/YrhL